MKKVTTNIRILLLICPSLFVGGCSTFNTINSAEPGTPKFYSGTRLNVNALVGNEVAMRKYKIPPPAHPLLDLPGSLILDTLISPLTGGAALYEVIFE